MRTFLKIIAGIIGTIVLLIIIAVISLILLVNPNNVKTQISQQIYTSTGRQLLIGNISWAIWPRLGIKAENVSLSDSPSFDNKIFAQAKQAEIVAKLAPLLDGHIELDHIIINGLNLNLIRNTQGVTNWQDLVKNSETNTPATAPIGPVSETLSVSPNKKIMLSLLAFTLKDASFNFSDQQHNKTVVINNLQFNAADWAVNRKFPVALSFYINSNQPQFTGNISFQSNVLFNQEQQLLTLNEMNLKVSHLDNIYPSDHLDATLNTDAVIELIKQNVTLSNLNASIANMNVRGNLQSIAFNKAIQMDGALQIPSFNLKQFLIAIGKISSNSNFPSDNLNVSLNSNVNFDNAKQVVSLSNLDAKLGNMQILGDLQGSSITQNIQLNGALKIPSFNLQQFLIAIGKSSSTSANAIQNVEASFQLQASSSGVTLNKLQANLDNMHVNGNLAVANFVNPAYQFKLNVDNMDTRRFSSTNSGSTNNMSNKSISTTDSGGFLPISLLKTLNANGQLSINQLTLSKATINNFYMQLNANNGLVQLNPLNGQIYQGQMQSNIAINVRNESPQYNIAANFTGIQINPLLTSLTDITRIKVSGSGNLSANVSATGNNSNAIKQSLTGSTKFSISNGILYGIDIPYYSDVADALLNKQIPAGTNTHQTAFGNLSGTATITNGLVSNNDLLVQAPELTVTGNGTINLVSEQLDYAMKMQRLLNGAPHGPEVPLIIKGTFSSPSIQPDIVEIAKKQIEQQIEKQLSQKLQNVIGSGNSDQQQQNSGGNNNVGQQLENAVGNGNVGQQLQKGLKSIFGP